MGNIIPIVIGALVGLAAGFVFGVVYRKNVAEKEIGSAELEATRLINEAIHSGENRKKEMLLEAKDEIHKSRTEHEKEVKERRAELSKQERRLEQKEATLDKKTEAFERKEEDLAKKLQKVTETQAESEQIKQQQMAALENISGFAGVWVSPYLHNWSLSDRTFDWFWEACADRKINIWVNTALSDDRFRSHRLQTRLVSNDEIKLFAEFAPQNKYVLQGVAALLDLSRVLPEYFLLEYSKISDSEYSIERFLAENSSRVDQLCRGSEYPFREFDAVDMVIKGIL